MTPVRHPGTGLSFDVPDDWKQEPKSEDTMVVTSPDGNAALVIFVVPTSAAGKVGDEVDKQLSSVMIDIKMDNRSASTETINGLALFTETGSARLKQDNKPVDLAVWMVKGSGDKSLMVIGMGDLKGNDDTLSAIRKSIHQGKPGNASSGRVD